MWSTASIFLYSLPWDCRMALHSDNCYLDKTKKKDCSADVISVILSL